MQFLVEIETLLAEVGMTDRITSAVQKQAAYRQALLKPLSADLSTRFGRWFSERNLEQMRQFYLSWPLEKISQTASQSFIDLVSLAQARPLLWLERVFAGEH